MDLDQLIWTNWQSISLECGRWRPAVYQMRLVWHGEPRQIDRFRGTDPAGLLTIGETKSMEQRRLDFITAMSKCYKHSAGNLLYLILKYCRMGADVTPEAVEYRYVELPTEGDAKHAEALLVRQYILRHCEPPPLNSAIPDRYGEKYGKWQPWAEEIEA
jgi:hypothetical protein